MSGGAQIKKGGATEKNTQQKQNKWVEVHRLKKGGTRRVPKVKGGVRKKDGGAASWSGLIHFS